MTVTARRIACALAPLLLAGTALAAPPAATTPPAPAAAPIASLVAKVQIPYESFTLPNGLTVIVHTDRKAPIVGVTTYYRVGSKNEPRGRTGFAHLYEHLFFGGSENAPSFFGPLENVGAGNTNGSTYYDRTNYVEVVPKGALDLALFLESDRMGHLLGAFNQARLDNQRSVVLNEKRQGDNNPGGLSRYLIGDNLWPVGHPYRHTSIGSKPDLDAATLDDVRHWFVDHYAPNNVVLALTGDIDLATAKAAVTRWYGDIPRGRPVAPVVAPRVDLPAPVRLDMTDQVATLSLNRIWSGPGLNDPDSTALAAGLMVLGGLSSARLDNELVRRRQIGVGDSAGINQLEQTSIIEVELAVKPGVARAEAETALDGEIAKLLAEGPTRDELDRAVTRLVAQQIDGLEEVGGFGGKGATLAEGQLYSGDPGKYRKDLADLAALTPQKVRDVMRKWLGRPVFALAVVPGARTLHGEDLGGWADGAPDSAAGKPLPPPLPPVAYVPGAKRAPPPVAPVADLVLPRFEHATLTNGIQVTFAKRAAVPKVLVALDFDAGYAADAKSAIGTQSLMLALLKEGTTTRSSIDIAAQQERLGASITTAGTLDASTITLSALSPNLAPSLALMADVARNPAFAPAEVARLKAQRLAEIAQATTSPVGIVRQVLGPQVYGPAHPYGVPASGLGTTAIVSGLTPEALRAAQQAWLRPDLARITVVGDTDMATLVPLLERAFGSWKAPSTPAPRKDLAAAIPARPTRIVFVDRPNSPQSMIYAGKALALRGADTDVTPDLADEVIGGGSLQSRLNADIRETKGWSYGVYTGVTKPVGPGMFAVMAPVQADRTGDTIRELVAQLKAYPATKPTTADELARVTEGQIRSLPTDFETDQALLGAVVNNRRLGRPENYQETLASRYRKVTAAEIDAAAARVLQPEGLVYVVVGDRKVVEPQLKDIGLPIEYMTVAQATGSAG